MAPPLRPVAVALLAFCAGARALHARPRVSMPGPPAVAGRSRPYYRLARRRPLRRRARFGSPSPPWPGPTASNSQPIRAGMNLPATDSSCLRDRGKASWVNIPEFSPLSLPDGTLNAVYPASVGLPTWQTPLGAFTVTVKNPQSGLDHAGGAGPAGKGEAGDRPAGEDNPLGDRWIGTSLKHTGIHSTNIPMTVGRPLSHGCVRLYPEHIKALFEVIEIGEAANLFMPP